MSQRVAVITTEESLASPLRRSSRIATSSPVTAAGPAPVNRRRSSANLDQPSTPAKLTRTKRLSLSHEASEEKAATPKRGTKSRAGSKSPTSQISEKETKAETPARRGRRSSITKPIEEESETDASSPKPVANRRRSIRGQSGSPTNAAPEPPQPAKPRGRRGSVTEKVTPLASIEESGQQPSVDQPKKTKKATTGRSTKIETIEETENEEILKACENKTLSVNLTKLTNVEKVKKQAEEEKPKRGRPKSRTGSESPTLARKDVASSKSPIKDEIEEKRNRRNSKSPGLEDIEKEKRKSINSPLPDIKEKSKSPLPPSSNRRKSNKSLSEDAVKIETSLENEGGNKIQEKSESPLRTSNRRKSIKSANVMEPSKEKPVEDETKVSTTASPKKSTEDTAKKVDESTGETSSDETGTKIIENTNRAVHKPLENLENSVDVDNKLNEEVKDQSPKKSIESEKFEKESTSKIHNTSQKSVEEPLEDIKKDPIEHPSPKRTDETQVKKDTNKLVQGDANKSNEATLASPKRRSLRLSKSPSLSVAENEVVTEKPVIPVSPAKDSMSSPQRKSPRLAKTNEEIEKNKNTTISPKPESPVKVNDFTEEIEVCVKNKSNEEIAEDLLLETDDELDGKKKLVKAGEDLSEDILLLSDIEETFDKKKVDSNNDNLEKIHDVESKENKSKDDEEQSDEGTKSENKKIQSRKINTSSVEDSKGQVILDHDGISTSEETDEDLKEIIKPEEVKNNSDNPNGEVVKKLATKPEPDSSNLKNSPSQGNALNKSANFKSPKAKVGTDPLLKNELDMSIGSDGSFHLNLSIAKTNSQESLTEILNEKAKLNTSTGSDGSDKENLQNLPIKLASKKSLKVTSPKSVAKKSVEIKNVLNIITPKSEVIALSTQTSTPKNSSKAEINKFEEESIAADTTVSSSKDLTKCKDSSKNTTEDEVFLEDKEVPVETNEIKISDKSESVDSNEEFVSKNKLMRDDDKDVINCSTEEAGNLIKNNTTPDDQLETEEEEMEELVITDDNEEETENTTDVKEESASCKLNKEDGENFSYKQDDKGEKSEDSANVLNECTKLMETKENVDAFEEHNVNSTSEIVNKPSEEIKENKESNDAEIIDSTSNSENNIEEADCVLNNPESILNLSEHKKYEDQKVSNSETKSPEKSADSTTSNSGKKVEEVDGSSSDSETEKCVDSADGNQSKGKGKQQKNDESSSAESGEHSTKSGEETKTSNINTENSKKRKREDSEDSSCEEEANAEEFGEEIDIDDSDEEDNLVDSDEDSCQAKPKRGNKLISTQKTAEENIILDKNVEFSGDEHFEKSPIKKAKSKKKTSNSDEPDASVLKVTPRKQNKSPKSNEIEEIAKHTDSEVSSSPAKKKSKKKSLKLSRNESDDHIDQKKENKEICLIRDNKELEEGDQKVENNGIVLDDNSSTEIKKRKAKHKKNNPECEDSGNTSDINMEVLEETNECHEKSKKKKKKSRKSTKDSNTDHSDEPEFHIKSKEKSKKQTDEAQLDDLLTSLVDRKMSEYNDSDDDEYDSEDNYPSNEFIDDAAFEGEEDTPSDGSNDIVEKGESLHSSDTEDESEDDDDYEDDSFIVDDESVELLSGNEYDIELESKPKKKKSRIIQCSDSESDEMEKDQIKTKEIKKKKSRIISSESEDDKETDVRNRSKELDEDNIESDDEVEEINEQLEGKHTEEKLKNERVDDVSKNDNMISSDGEPEKGENIEFLEEAIKSSDDKITGSERENEDEKKGKKSKKHQITNDVTDLDDSKPNYNENHCNMTNLKNNKQETLEIHDVEIVEEKSDESPTCTSKKNSATNQANVSSKPRKSAGKGDVFTKNTTSNGISDDQMTRESENQLQTRKADFELISPIAVTLDEPSSLTEKIAKEGVSLEKGSVSPSKEKAKEYPENEPVIDSNSKTYNVNSDEDAVISIQDSDSEEEKISNEEKKSKIKIIQDIKISKKDGKSLVVNSRDNLNSLEEIEEIKEQPVANKFDTSNSSFIDMNSSRRKSTRRTSISFQENIKVSNMANNDINEKITKVVDFLCSSIKDNKGNLSLNVSLDYANSSNEDDIPEKPISDPLCNFQAGKKVEEMRLKTIDVNLGEGDIQMKLSKKKKKKGLKESSEKKKNKKKDILQASDEVEASSSKIMKKKKIKESECKLINEDYKQHKATNKSSKDRDEETVNIEDVVNRKQSKKLKKNIQEVTTINDEAELHQLKRFKKSKKNMEEDLENIELECNLLQGTKKSKKNIIEPNIAKVGPVIQRKSKKLKKPVDEEPDMEEPRLEKKIKKSIPKMEKVDKPKKRRSFQDDFTVNEEDIPRMNVKKIKTKEEKHISKQKRKFSEFHVTENEEPEKKKKKSKSKINYLASSVIEKISERPMASTSEIPHENILKKKNKKAIKITPSASTLVTSNWEVEELKVEKVKSKILKNDFRNRLIYDTSRNKRVKVKAKK